MPTNTPVTNRLVFCSSTPGHTVCSTERVKLVPPRFSASIFLSGHPFITSHRTTIANGTYRPHLSAGIGQNGMERINSPTMICTAYSNVTAIDLLFTALCSEKTQMVYRWWSGNTKYASNSLNIVFQLAGDEYRRTVRVHIKSVCFYWGSKAAQHSAQYHQYPKSVGYECPVSHVSHVVIPQSAQRFKGLSMARHLKQITNRPVRPICSIVRCRLLFLICKRSFSARSSVNCRSK